MNLALKKEEDTYTWKDYQNFPDDERWEIIEGTAVAMAPAPSVRHQSISGELYRKLADYFDDKKCRILPAPVDVKLSETDVLQPDLLVVSDPKQIKETHIEGAPSLVIEILSPNSVSHDRLRKMHLYLKYAVKEYWIADPATELIEVFTLDNKGYRLSDVYDQQSILQSPLFPDLELDLQEIFKKQDITENK